MCLLIHWVDVNSEKFSQGRRFCNLLGVASKDKLLACSSHCVNIVGTHWRVWRAKCEVMIQVM